MTISNIQICPTVPFRPEMVYCYPAVHLEPYDIWALVIALAAILLILGLYMSGKAK